MEEKQGRIIHIRIKPTVFGTMKLSSYVDGEEIVIEAVDTEVTSSKEAFAVDVEACIVRPGCADQYGPPHYISVGIRGGLKWR